MPDRQVLGRIEARGAMNTKARWMQAEAKVWSRRLGVMMLLWQGRVQKSSSFIL